MKTQGRQRIFLLDFTSFFQDPLVRIPSRAFLFILLGVILRVAGGTAFFCVMGNYVSHDTKASGGRRTLRRGRWLLTQPRFGAGVRQAHTFLKENFHKSRSFFVEGKRRDRQRLPDCVFPDSPGI